MAENEPEDESDLASRLAGAMGSGDPDTRKPVSLTEALYQRVIDVTREEVSQTTEVLGEVVVQIGRLERRFNTLAAHLEGDVPLPDGGGALQDRLERLDALLGRLESEPGSTAEPAVAGEVAQVINRGLAEIRTALLTSQPDLTPVVRAIHQSVDDMRAEIAGMLPPAPAAGSDDSEVIAHQLSDLRVGLSEIRDQLADSVGARPEHLDAAVASSSARVEAALADLRDAQTDLPDRVTAELEALTAALADLRDTQTDLPDRVTAELEALAAALRSEMVSLRASFPQPDPPDLRPVLESIHGLGAGLRDELAALPVAEPVDIDPVLAAVADLRRAVPPATDLEPLQRAVRELRQDLPQTIDLQPIHQALSDLHQSLPEAVDLQPISQALAEMRQALPELAPTVDLSSVTSAVNELRGAIASQIDQLHGAMPAPADADEIGRSVSGQVADAVRASVAGATGDLAARVEDLQAGLAALTARYAAKMDELRNGVADDSERLAERIDAVGERAGRAPDLSPVIDTLQFELESLRSSLPAPAEPVDLTPLHEEVAATRTAQEHSVALLRAALEDAVARMREHASDEANRLRQSIPDAPDPVDMAPILHSLDDLRSDVTAIDGAGLAQALSAIRSRVDQPAEPVDLSPVIEAIDRGLRSTAEDLKASRPAPPDLSPVLAALAQMQESVGVSGTEHADRIASAVDAVRSQQDQQRHELMSRLGSLADELRAVLPPPVDLGPVLNRIDETSNETRLAAEVERDAAAAATEQVQSLLRSLEALGEASAERAAALSERMGVVEQLGFDEAARTAAVAQAVEELGQVQQQRDEEIREALISHLDRIESDRREQGQDTDTALAELGSRTQDLATAIARVSEHIESQPPDEVLIGEVRGLLDGLRDEMASVRASVEPEVLLNTFAEGADRAVDRLGESAEAAMGQLTSATEGVMARIDRRDSQLGSIKVDLENAVQRALREAEADMARIVGDVGSSVDALTRGLEGVQSGLRDNDHRDELRDLTRSIESGMTDLGGAVANDLNRVTTSISELARDLASTRERVLELDRNLTGLRNEVGGTAEVARASYQTADTLQALIPAIASLENRVGAQLDDLGARLESLAALVDDRVPDQPPPAQRQDTIALEVGTRLDAIREVAAGITEALRNDRKKRRNRALGSGPG